MIYLFAGNNQFQILQEKKKWKDVFVEKYGDFNLFHIKNIFDVDVNYLSEVLLSGGFLGDKKLIIIEDYPVVGKNQNDTDDEGESTNTKTKQYDEFFLENFSKIPEENIVLFICPSPDKRTKLYKEIQKNNGLRDMSFSDDREAIVFLQKFFHGNIPESVIREVFQLKGKNILKTSSEIEKLEISGKNLDTHLVRQVIQPEFEESIFIIIDNLLSKNISQGLQGFSTLVQMSNIYALYNSLLSNFRVLIYIMHLKSLGISPQKISQILQLGNRAFLVNKSYKISYPDFQKLYISLIDIDKKRKTGKALGTDDEDFYYEIEKVIISHF